jgi:hypothetical protein
VILGSDSERGLVYSINLQKRNYKVAIKSELFDPLEDPSSVGTYFPNKQTPTK